MSTTMQEPVLALDNIQGNILEGFNKSHQHLLGFKIRDVVEAQNWLLAVIPLITTAAVVHEFMKEFRPRRREQKDKSEADTAAEVHEFIKEKFRQQPREQREELGEYSAAWMNIAFSCSGIKQLVKDIDLSVFSQAFLDGQWRRAQSILGDSQEANSPDNPCCWKVGGSEQKTPDIFVICAADNRTELGELVQKVRDRIPYGSLEEIYEDFAENLQEGDIGRREHFGFKDGISLLRVRGQVSKPPGEFLCARDPNVPQNPTLPEFAVHGQPLIWPGQFVLGYPRQSATDPRACLPETPFKEGYDWLQDGSYLVFRRLRQDVAAFRRFVKEESKQLGENPAFAGLTPERFEAMLVGRWPNGTPLALSPDQDTPPLNSNEINDFFYLRKPLGTPPVRGKEPSMDIMGKRCPVSAHIRKVNPRDQGTDRGPAAENLCRSLLRRGIPYGPYLKVGDENDPSIAGADRGLLFLCYQASIEETFEALMQNWVNSTAGPTSPQGFDMLIGKNLRGNRQRWCVLEGKNGHARVATSLPFVYATGGGYFFAPSLSALREKLAR